MRDSLKIVEGVTEKLTKLDETNRQVVGFADQLKDLQDILKNPKQRGVLGEFYLEEILKNVLPPSSYQMQYKFKDGEIVDAVIFLRDNIVPIDAKFSLENYERLLEERNEEARKKLEQAFKADLKNRIDETAKYIRPAEKTLEFAFMFIPAEAIYYDLLVNKVGAVKISTRDLIDYAMKEKRVIIVSPTSFHAYLQTVLQGLRALEIEQSAKEIRKNVEQLQRHLLNYESYNEKMGNQLGTVVRTYNAGNKQFKQIDKDLYKITGSGGEMEPLELELPKQEEE
jgi:DNA recombination protein RmuC